MSTKPLFALAIVLLTAVACGDDGSTAGPSASGAASDTPSTRPASKAPTSARTSASEKLPDGYDPKRNPKADIAAALAKARGDKRPVLIDFGADWCPDCVVLGRTFRTAKVRPVIGRFHVVSVDVGRFDRNLNVVRKYGVNLRASGIPALVVLSSTGKVRTATNDGSFANAQSMSGTQVAAFLKHWQ
ncbi:thioredoxin family protein [Actinomadura roseirufa]|uniref:thioredoxin family protein n=1 Tax=Actinomadura roseirufa TaxID=2094049 RepID=UPI0013F167EC|nr:thioredoxin family protein [Actinomadura roseirufa]